MPILSSLSISILFFWRLFIKISRDIRTALIETLYGAINQSQRSVIDLQEEDGSSQMIAKSCNWSNAHTMLYYPKFLKSEAVAFLQKAHHYSQDLLVLNTGGEG